MLPNTDINYMAPRYRPGRTIVPATKDRFTNNLPDFSQLLCVPINTNELDKMTSNMGTIFSNTLETIAPIKLKRLEKNVLRHGTTVIPGLQTATKTVAFATKNIHLRVKFLLRSPLATIYIYMLRHKNLHVRTFFLIVLRSHLLLCSRIKLKIKREYASKF